MEIAAVYWESKIKIYGFNHAVNLSLLKMTVETEQMAKMGLCISKLDDLGIGFHLVMAQHSNNHKLHLYLLSSHPWDEKGLKNINKEIRADAESPVQVVSPVELIYFQGPHFGDRYGIAYSAFRILENKNITLLLAGCSGSVIYLVLPEGGAKNAEPFLAEAFEVP